MEVELDLAINCEIKMGSNERISVRDLRKGRLLRIKELGLAENSGLMLLILTLQTLRLVLRCLSQQSLEQER